MHLLTYKLRDGREDQIGGDGHKGSQDRMTDRKSKCDKKDEGRR